MIKSTGSADVSSNIPQERPEGFLPKPLWLWYLKPVAHIWHTRVKIFTSEVSQHFDQFKAKQLQIPAVLQYKQAWASWVGGYVEVPSQQAKLQNNWMWLLKSVHPFVCACHSSHVWICPPSMALWSWLFGLASWSDSSEHIINSGQLNRCQNTDLRFHWSKPIPLMM